MNKQKGFGLVEIIIVIAIIAVLAGIIISRQTGDGQKPITQYTQDAKEISVKTTLNSLKASFNAKLAEAGTISSICFSPPEYPNYSFLKNINDSFTGMGYSFICEEAGENANCSESSSMWYAVTCNSKDACYCTDSTSGSVAISGNYNQFLGSSVGSGPRNCACR